MTPQDCRFWLFRESSGVHGRLQPIAVKLFSSYLYFTQLVTLHLLKHFKLSSSMLLLQRDGHEHEKIYHLFQKNIKPHCLFNETRIEEIWRKEVGEECQGSNITSGFVWQNGEKSGAWLPNITLLFVNHDKGRGVNYKVSIVRGGPGARRPEGKEGRSRAERLCKRSKLIRGKERHEKKLFFYIIIAETAVKGDQLIKCHEKNVKTSGRGRGNNK